MAKIKYLNIIFLLIIFIRIISLSLCEENSTNNASKSNYEYEEDEDDEYEEDRKKRKNETFIIILNDSNYTNIINQYEALFMIFYPSPCTSCKLFMPHYVRLSHYAYEKKMDLKFSKIDGNKNQQLVQKYNIESFPTIILIFQNKTYYYDLDINSASLLKFYNKIKNGPIRELPNLYKLEIVLKAYMKILLSTITDKSLLLYKSLVEYASTNNKIEFVSCISEDCIEKYGKDEIIFFHEGEEKINYYSKDYESIDKANINSVKNFMSIFNVQYGAVLDQQSKLDILFENDNKKALFYIRDSNNEKYTSKDILFKELGKELRMQNIYTYVLDIKGDDIFELISNFFVVSEIELPTLIYYDLVDKKQNSNTYRIMNIREKNINKQYIMDFIEKVKKGKIKRDLHTSFPPKYKEKDGLINVVGRTYDKDVIENKKNVLILFYDGKKENEISNKYKELMIDLSEKYTDDENFNLVFDIIDGRVNEPRDIVFDNVDEFPLIYLYTNFMKEKKVLRFVPQDKNMTNMVEIEDFLVKNLKQDNLNENDL
jgi:thiol-disulfide isomerase/thioredoxin